MKKKKRKLAQSILNTRSMRCPYCGSPVTLKSADGIYKENSRNTQLYVCSRYPACDAYVRVLPGTNTPVGSMANRDLRALRREAHQHFDRLHLSGIMSKHEAYDWLASILQYPKSQAHIGYLGEYYCKLVIEESSKILKNCKKTSAYPRTNEGGEFCASKR